MIGSLDFSINEAAMFQASIASLTESLQPAIETKHYFGRSEPIRVYKYTERSISIEFLVYAPSFASLQHVKERINFLVKSCYPTYEGSAIGGAVGAAVDFFSGDPLAGKDRKYKEPPIMMITVGDLFVDLPGIIQSLEVDWLGSSGRWELERGARMPQVARVTMDYLVLHKTMPERTLGADFYPGLQVDELYATQGGPPGTGFAQGREAQNVNDLISDLDDGWSLANMKNFAEALISLSDKSGSLYGRGGIMDNHDNWYERKIYGSWED